MKVVLDRRERSPMYMQIRNQIRDQIYSGELAAGSRLPAERALALQLGVNRSTIVRAYEELAADGLVEARVGRGTTVKPLLASASRSGPDRPATLLGSAPGAAGPDRPATLLGSAPGAAGLAGGANGAAGGAMGAFNWQPTLNRYGQRLQDSTLASILNMLSGPSQISFAGGVPDPSFYPLEMVQACSRDILEREWEEALDYSGTAGLPGMRQVLCQHLARAGCSFDPDSILVCSGSQQCLDILARVLIYPGDSIIIEEPTYIGAINAFRLAGARLITIPLDQDGMRVDILEEQLLRHQPRFIYTLPSAHNPAACTMSLERRRRLISLAYKHRVPILEDDAYGSLYYTPEPAPLLASMDPGGLVVYLGSASKMLFPGLRLGWMAGAPPIINACMLIKQVSDLHSASYSQLLMERLLDPDFLNAHLANIRGQYREKRDAMLDALAAYAGPGVRWSPPDGGVYVWVELPPAVSAARLLVRTEARGVVFMPGAPFFAEGGGEHFMRLSFARHGPGQIRAGIEIICDEIRQLQGAAGGDTPAAPGSNLHLL